MQFRSIVMLSGTAAPLPKTETPGVEIGWEFFVWRVVTADGNLAVLPEHHIFVADHIFHDLHFLE